MGESSACECYVGGTESANRYVCFSWGLVGGVPTVRGETSFSDGTWRGFVLGLQEPPQQMPWLSPNISQDGSFRNKFWMPAFLKGWIKQCYNDIFIFIKFSLIPLFSVSLGIPIFNCGLWTWSFSKVSRLYPVFFPSSRDCWPLSFTGKSPPSLSQLWIDSCLFLCKSTVVRAAFLNSTYYLNITSFEKYWRWCKMF